MSSESGHGKIKPNSHAKDTLQLAFTITVSFLNVTILASVYEDEKFSSLISRVGIH